MSKSFLDFTNTVTMLVSFFIFEMLEVCQTVLQVEESTKKQVETALTLRQEHSGSFIKNTGEILPY